MTRASTPPTKVLQNFLLETKVLDGLFWLARAPRLAGITLDSVYKEQELRHVEMLCGEAIVSATQSNARVQLYVARRKFEGIRDRKG